MPNAPTPLDPIAQLVAKYQSNGHQQPVPQPQQKKSWTGFVEKTLWDWLNFFVQLIGVIAIPLVIFSASNILSSQQQKIADNQLQEAILKTFRDDINRLVFDQHLLTAKYGDPVQIMAQSYTNDALRKLDVSRRILLVQFLNDLRLITSITTSNFPLISLSKPNLGGANLHQVNLSTADLSTADLSTADLSIASLCWTNLYGADLREADLSWADLLGADLHEANLSWANLSGAYLSGAYLSEANLSGANLSEAYLGSAYPSVADPNIPDLSGAQVTPKQLAEAWKLKGAILPDGSHYPSSSYPIPNHQEPIS